MNDQRPVQRFRPPSVDRVLKDDVALIAIARFGHAATANAVRAAVRLQRASGASPELYQRGPDAEAVLRRRRLWTARRRSRVIDQREHERSQGLLVGCGIDEPDGLIP